MRFGAQKNRLTETVILSTRSICFDWEIRKKYIGYALYTKGLLYKLKAWYFNI